MRLVIRSLFFVLLMMCWIVRMEMNQQMSLVVVERELYCNVVRESPFESLEQYQNRELV